MISSAVPLFLMKTNRHSSPLNPLFLPLTVVVVPSPKVILISQSEQSNCSPKMYSVLGVVINSSEAAFLTRRMVKLPVKEVSYIASSN